jgi:glycosyltransferase involved in cell wall biosynthesis
MESKLNILFLNYSLNVGGIETLILEMCKRLDNDSFKSFVCVLDSNGDLENEFKNRGVPVYCIKKGEGVDFSLPFKLYFLIKKLRIDILHTHNRSSWLYGSIAAKLAMIPSVHTVHTSIDRTARWIKIETYLAMLTNKVATVTESIAKFMIEVEKVFVKKIKVIHNGIDYEIFSKFERAKQKRYELGFQESDLLIGCIARFHPIKDHKTLLLAFHEISKVIPCAKLILIGDGPLKEQTKQLTTELQLNSKVYFLGNRRDIAELLKTFNLFVLSSLREGLPIALLEAMASGTPVIATEVDGNSELISHRETGLLVPPDNPHALSKAIIQLYNEKNAAERYAQAAKEKVKQNFSFDYMINQYIAVYNELTCSRNKKRLRVAIIGEFPPLQGGMAIQAQLFSENLKKEQIQVLCIKRNMPFNRGWLWIDRIKIIRSVVRFIAFNKNILKASFRVKTFYIFSNSGLCFYIYTMPAIIMGRLFGKKIVIAYHGGAASDFLNKRINFIARWVLKIPDSITVPSNYLKDIFQTLGYTAVVIPNIIDLQRFHFRIREKLLPHFLVTRHLEPEYNVEMIIKTFKIILKKYPQAMLKICGNGTEKLRLEKLTRQLDLNGSVNFLGNVENDKITQIYDNADLFLNGSNIDNLPLAILEAFACGLPVITTNAGGIGYLIQHKYNGLLVGLNDYEQMAQFAIELLENSELAQSLVKNAHHNLQEYSWETVKPKLIRILQEN